MKLNNETTQLRITPDMIKSSKIIKCDCGGMLFKEGFIFKRLSPLISPTGKEEMFPINVIICESCGKVPTDFNPNNIVPDQLLATGDKTN